MHIEPPPGFDIRGLTFAKHCRFSNVRLSREGIETRGIIWKVQKLINPRYCRQTRYLPRGLAMKIQSRCRWKTPKGKYLNFKDHEALWVLHHSLTSHSELAKRLARFLESSAPLGYDEDWTDQHIKHLMAISVARAFRDGRSLRLGSMWRGEQYSPYTAIFIENGNDARGRDNYFTFTSWTRATEVRQEELLIKRCSSKYVSLEIGRVDYTHGPTKIKPKRWINGLCFFGNSDANNVIVGWPRYFLDA
jgi:hypothetical protein